MKTFLPGFYCLQMDGHLWHGDHIKRSCSQYTDVPTICYSESNIYQHKPVDSAFGTFDLLGCAKVDNKLCLQLIFFGCDSISCPKLVVFLNKFVVSPKKFSFPNKFVVSQTNWCFPMFPPDLSRRMELRQSSSFPSDLFLPRKNRQFSLYFRPSRTIGFW